MKDEHTPAPLPTEIEPDSLFAVWSADEVAECLPGVSKPLYSRLWDLVDDTPRGETPDTCFGRALAKTWHRLDAADQSELNRLAASHLATIKA